MKQVILISFALLAIGCIKKYKGTTRVCGGKFYVESFNVNPAGVDEDYFTDSINFRVYVGKFDNEHENFSYVCNGDSIKVMKSVMDGYGNKMKISDSKMLSLVDLKDKKVSNNKPLFEFK